MPDDARAIQSDPTEGLAFVEGEMNYLRPMAEKPYTLAFYTEPGDLPTNAIYDAHKVRIHDARPIAATASLDVEGFALARRPSAVTDWYDEAQLDGVCHDEAAQLVKDITGAARVQVFDHTLRIRREDIADRTPGMARLPVLRVHNDYTERSGPQRVRDVLPDEAEELLKHRFAFINVWRPIRGPVLDTPLAVADARSVPPDDFIASDMVYKDRKGEIYVNTFSPSHRWFYAPRMTTDEALLIKCYDSRTDVARFTAHSAFTDPTTPADAEPRASIEIRTVAFFAE
jgi:hypothetical protein